MAKKEEKEIGFVTRDHSVFTEQRNEIGDIRSKGDIP